MLKIDKGSVVFAFLLLFSIFACAEKRTFIRLEKPSGSKGRLYFIRPIESTLAIWSYEFRLEKFKGHFRNSPPRTTVATFALENGHYFTEELEEGFYHLAIPSKPGVEKIFKIEKGKNSYLRFMIFNEKEISIADFFIKEISEAEALSDLLENDHLTEAERR